MLAAGLGVPEALFIQDQSETKQWARVKSLNFRETTQKA